jgi:eukaryotic-like serine/threonine-protein kinase
MDTGLTRRAFAVFEDALDIEDEGERDVWLISACGGDNLLYAEVKNLLRADAIAERAMPTGGLRPGDSPMPARVGRYRIVDRLGQGGMGEVFVGARDDGLFDHAVAIKRIRPSLLPETARALFDRERRALATLSHRHIAQLYDGGVDETGAPYFIMELVRGAPIDAYVSDGDLSPRQIVEKMIQVCEAVQHAHQNLIVHADLKPANILVNEAGDPKVVDFGVARLLRDTDDVTLHPQTPGYASPQREAGASPTPADDVFALGAILRALLTGEAPCGSSHTVSASEAILKSAAFVQRPAKWREARAHVVHGDLDAIIQRACAPLPEDRYQAAVALAADLRAWTEVRPLAGRSDDRLYVFQKFIRRRRWRVMAAAAGGFGLVVALMVASTLYVQADFARREAEARFTEVRSLAKYVMYDLYDRLEATPMTLVMRRDTARVAQGYLDQLAETPSAPPDVMREAADGLVRIADLQSGRSRANLGEPAAARDNLDRASQIVSALQKSNPGDPRDTILLTRIALRRAAIAMNLQQDLETAGKLIDEADVLLGQLPAGRDTQVLTLEYEVEAATLGNWNGAYGESSGHARKALALASAIPPAPDDSREMHYLAARAQDALAESIYYGVGEAASEPEYQRMVEITSAYLEKHPDDMLGRRMAIEAHWALGTVFLAINRPQDALVSLDLAAALVPELLRYQPDDDGAARTERIVLTARAQALAMSGRFSEGVALLRGQVDRREALYREKGQEAEFARSYAIGLNMLGDLYADNNRAKDACPLYTQSEQVFMGLEKRNALSQLDRDSALKMARERLAKHCGS